MLLQCNNSEIRPGKHIGVCISVANNRLFVGSIPKSKTKEQIIEEFSKVTGKEGHHTFDIDLHFNKSHVELFIKEFPLLIFHWEEKKKNRILLLYCPLFRCER